jgi:hypothetical protein
MSAFIHRRNHDPGAEFRRHAITTQERFSDSAKVVAGLLFLTASACLWLSISSEWGKALYYSLFVLPNYACGQWLGSKIFSQELGLSISESGFSLLRIVIAVLFVLTLFGLVYGLAFVMKWLAKVD